MTCSTKAPLPDIMTLHVPYQVVKRGGRKEIQLPSDVQQHRCSDSALVKALSRAFRWKRMLDAGEFTTISELAEHERIAHSYMTRVLRLTLLAPDIVDGILDGSQARTMALPKMLKPCPADWTEQRSRWNSAPR